jgi:hypothetical protein
VNPADRLALRKARALLELVAVEIETALTGDHAVPSGEMDCTHPADKRVPVPTSGHPDAFICNACGIEVE